MYEDEPRKNRGSNELVLNPGEYAFLQDNTKGNVQTFVGPIVVTQTGQNRWQYQGWLEKYMRWIYFVLPYYPRAAIAFIAGFFGFIEPGTTHAEKTFGANRRLWAKHQWTVTMSEAWYGAGHYYTSEEMITLVKKRRDDAKPSQD